MKITDERIIKFLEKRLLDKNISLEKFLNPEKEDLRDAMGLKNMGLAVQKIKAAIKENKKILVFGDYDADGICSSVILYSYLKSVGANVQVFIPNRFENGYGISVEAIDEIEFEYAPDLVITVDLGITAIEEVEILKQEGIDIVITDHHIPLDELPDAVVVDPKVDPDGTYGFDALCGAGVALKLVEALSSREEALKYLDVCAVATVGDIVPLVDENRAIAKLGIDKINSGECLPSLTFLKNKLGIEKLTSSDISFKIVPRINACGRMSSAIKAFDFLVEKDEKLLEVKYADIETDNMLRLSAIESGNNEIAKYLEKYDLSLPSVVVLGKFHEGIIGILASRVCGDYARPAIIFTEDEDGNYKGSGRSVPEVDLHEIISSISGLLEAFGGHKMACGLTVSPENFDKFKEEFNKKLEEYLQGLNIEEKQEKEPDIIISDDDFNERFVREISALEPFGCENEKPEIAIVEDKMRFEPVSDKAFKHYRLFTKKNNMIVAFNAFKDANTCSVGGQKMLSVDLGTSTYKGRTNLNVVLKKIRLISPKFENNLEQELMGALYNKYYSIFDFNNEENYHVVENPEVVAKQKFDENKNGTIVVVSSNEDLENLEKIGIPTEKYISHNLSGNGKNTILVSPFGLYREDGVKSYKNIIFMHKFFDRENLHYSKKLNTYENKTILTDVLNLDKSRETFAKVYKLILEFAGLKANDELDLAAKLSIKSGIRPSQILFCMLVFMELNFIEFDEVLNQMKVLKSKKMELDSSKMYGAV